MKHKVHTHITIQCPYCKDIFGIFSSSIPPNQKCPLCHKNVNPVQEVSL